MPLPSISSSLSKPLSSSNDGTTSRVTTKPTQDANKSLLPNSTAVKQTATTTTKPSETLDAHTKASLVALKKKETEYIELLEEKIAIEKKIIDSLHSKLEEEQKMSTVRNKILENDLYYVSFQTQRAKANYYSNDTPKETKPKATRKRKTTTNKKPETKKKSKKTDVIVSDGDLSDITDNDLLPIQDEENEEGEEMIEINESIFD